MMVVWSIISIKVRGSAPEGDECVEKSMAVIWRCIDRSIDFQSGEEAGGKIAASLHVAFKSKINFWW